MHYRSEFARPKIKSIVNSQKINSQRTEHELACVNHIEL